MGLKSYPPVQPPEYYDYRFAPPEPSFEEYFYSKQSKLPLASRANVFTFPLDFF
jgi:hypothetical protein